MKYILILGQNYRDCKAKLDSIVKEAGTTYTLVTKPKHVAGFESSGVIEAANAKKNPAYNDIKKSIKGIFTSPIVEKVPVVEEISVPPVIEEEVMEAVPEETPMIDELPKEIEEFYNTDVMDELEKAIEEELAEVVEEEVIPEVEEEPVVDEEEEVIPKVVPEEEEAEIKPVDPPRGWHARAEYVDVAGNIFKKGKYVGKIVD